MLTEPTTPRNADSEGQLPAGPLFDGTAHSSLHILKLQLAPASLGIVNVVLAKSEAALSVRLEVEVGDTAERLEADRLQLSERMAATGCELTSLVITRATADADISPHTPRSPAAPSRNEPDGTDASARDRRDAERDERGSHTAAVADASGRVARTTLAHAPGASIGGDRFLGARILRSF